MARVRRRASVVVGCVAACALVVSATGCTSVEVRPADVIGTWHGPNGGAITVFSDGRAIFSDFPRVAAGGDGAGVVSGAAKWYIDPEVPHEYIEFVGTKMTSSAFNHKGWTGNVVFGRSQMYFWTADPSENKKYTVTRSSR
ncbi:hypothetical protein [Frondihabitans australicus]|uniref:Lipoprotein n=1 Tax=Frondihabitans australicus TaxID=386892 RepID=A0A495IKL0_9MICO|nr:hypothetical protein [Frondihabitans australicus]RKR76504.1 hypothetical protein C8E83_3681 [Frondihabitans australicus]